MSSIVKTVVIIDDNATNKYLIETILDGRNYNMLFFDSSREFLNELHKIEKIDLMLTDFLLPDLNALELVDYLNETNQPGYDFPKIVLTAMFNDYNIAENFFEGKFDGIILKPFDPNQLTDMIDTLN